MPDPTLRERLIEAELAAHVELMSDGHPSVIAHSNKRAADRAIAALASDPGNLPARMAEVIASREWTDFPRSAHNQHSYYAECAVCQRDIPRMAEVALGVRDELVAHLSARTAAAEARVGHAEAGAQLSSERLAEVRQELAEAKRGGRELGRTINRLAEIMRTTVMDGVADPYNMLIGLADWLAEADGMTPEEHGPVVAALKAEARSQRHAGELKAMIEQARAAHQRCDDGRTTFGGLHPWCGTCSVAWPCPTIAALTAPVEGTTTPARETA